MTQATFAARAVAFDLDGTLADTLPDLTAAANAMLSALGLPGCDRARVRSLVGDGAAALVERLLGARAPKDPALAMFLDAYAERNGREARLYPGVEDGLAALAARRLPLAVVTNKPARLSEALIGALGIAGHFTLVVGGDTLARRKPDPMPLEHAASGLGVPAGELLMVGDSAVDVACARAAGAAVAAVRYGYHAGASIDDAHPDAVIDSLEELPALIGGPTRASPGTLG